VKTHVIVLAQGRQERMGSSIDRPKQLLPLPACGGVPLMVRTLHQLARLLWGRPDDTSIEFAAQNAVANQVTVVSWHEVFDVMRAHEISVPYLHHPGGTARLTMMPEVVSLLDPGNSSLKGIHRYLETLALTAGAPRAERTVVLLGDVVYSWACLGAILAEHRGAFLDSAGCPRCRFVGTSDISRSGGEIWGLSWERVSDTRQSGRQGVIEALESAVENHPPFQAYQPGQLRRWMWQIHPSFQATVMYERIDDYTMDVDLPQHLDKLLPVSQLAWEDDRRHGLVW
jgi:hypothetical protein